MILILFSNSNFLQPYMSTPHIYRSTIHFTLGLYSPFSCSNNFFFLSFLCTPLLAAHCRLLCSFLRLGCYPLFCSLLLLARYPPHLLLVLASCLMPSGLLVILARWPLLYSWFLLTGPRCTRDSSSLAPAQLVSSCSLPNALVSCSSCFLLIAPWVSTCFQVIDYHNINFLSSFSFSCFHFF
jgi:hypothetical protein